MPPFQKKRPRKEHDFFLKGGARLHNPPKTLISFLKWLLREKGTRVKEIKPLKKIGEGGEGVVYAVEVTLQKVGKGGEMREKTLRLAEKKFWRVHLKTPGQQFTTMMHLIALNRHRRLGLRILPTIRLLKRSGQTSLILTKLKQVIPQNTLSREQYLEFGTDRARQQNILFASGFHANQDAFFAVPDKKTGAIVAILADFGGITERNQEE